MNRYIFDDKSEDREYRRLQLVEVANDPNTIPLLEDTGIQTGWHCLELGAGAGSILQWLGTRVGATGLAVGIDKKHTYLKKFESPPFRILQGSFLEIHLDHLFDLIHVRYVLIHNLEDLAILRKLLDLLKPGGFAVLEEPDFTSARLSEHGQDNPQSRVVQAICRMFVNLGLDPGYALRLPHKMESVGFHITRVQSLMHLCPGNSPMARVMGESALVLEKEYCSTGLCFPKDIQQYVDLTRDSNHWTLYHSTTSVIARKPQR